MKKYLVSIPWYATVLIQVEAKNKKEAITLGLEKAYPQTCVHCSDEIQMDEQNDNVEPDAEEIDED